LQNAILVINAGSSSLKFAGYLLPDARSEPTQLGKGQIEGIGTAPHFIVKDEDGNVVGEHHWPSGESLDHSGSLRFLIEWIQQNATDVRVAAAGHRVVHGGLTFTGPTRIDADVMVALEKLVPLAPLHQPHNLAAIRALAEVDPGLPQIACFDTAYHRTLPLVASTFALPRALIEQGVRRYGFHGLSYEYIASRLPGYAPGASRVVTAHLGSGASLCAMRDGKSIETTMGFTAVDGLPMGTRTGALDPGVVLYFMQTLGMDAAAIETLIYKESGLLGVSGISNDMRTLAASDDPRATEAIDLFVYHICKQTGALSAALEGLDTLVFTAGIGENSPLIRERVCRRLAWLGLRFDALANTAGEPRISTEDSPVSAWVIPTDEERMIAIHTARALGKLPA
jgi:acetate kinase